ncbi:CinA family protein [Bosea psychrotolerans]|uniref:Nicotinamide-nucleotide amidase n=1 Tax=Bosea psychrotolerans TaxID=1871628 RepID=A0A2S4MCR7_9HYPH|nr:CinA family protein [Bosea psychrotolerans]POR52514.1 nicotinamide-nucleotide amidase [Bosea psychrotolerans]
MYANAHPAFEAPSASLSEIVFGLPGPEIPPAPSLAELLVSRMIRARKVLVTAESCTAGKLAHLISDVPGAAQVLEGGFVVYSKRAKQQLLGVGRDIIADFTAVSEAVAEAMVAGALERSGADLAIAATGVTGSEPDEDGNPLGRLHVMAGLRNGSRSHRHCEFGSFSPDVLTHAALQMALLSALELLDRPKDGKPLFDPDA